MKDRLIYRIIPGVILIAALCFMLLHFGQFKDLQAYDHEDIVESKGDSEVLNLSDVVYDVKGDKGYKKSFVARTDSLEKVGLCFKCANNDNRRGEIKVRILDERGEVVAEAPIDISKIRNGRLAITSLRSESFHSCKLNKGEPYEIEVISDNLKSDFYFALRSVEGKEGEFYSALVYGELKKKVVAFYIGLILLGFLMLFIKLKDEKQAVMLRLQFFVTPFLCYILMRKITGLKITESITGLFSYAGLMNFLIILFIWGLLYVLTNRIKVSIVLTTIINLLFIIVNYALILFRDKPLLFNDILQWKTAAMVANSYVLTFDQSAVIVSVVSAVWIAVALSLKAGERFKGKMRLILAGIFVIASIGVFNYMFVSDALLDHDVKVSDWKPSRSYKEHGYYICFAITAKHSRIEKPKGYSVDKIEAIAKKYPSDKAVKATNTTEKTPNIIVIMNESFADLSYFGKIDTNEPILPFFNSLKENTIKGVMHSSILGGHTAISEFEFLTGDSQRFIFSNAIPYSSVIKKDTPSFAWDMKALGYGGNIAFHPGYASSYNRDVVYPLLGFDEHISSEKMAAPKRVRRFISDEADYDRLISEYDEYREKEKMAPFFMFNVTIQNHGGYTAAVGEVEPHQIDILDSELMDEETEQFLNLMKISDQALEELINHFEKVKEPTIIMMYGDHQPRVGKTFYRTMNARSKGLSEIEKEERKYRVPFMVWANYDIEEEQDVELSANYMSSYLKTVVGAPMTGYQKYLLDVRKELPVITAIGTIDKDGTLKSADEEIKQKSLLEEYRCLQYNQLVDRKNQPKDFYYLKQ